MVSTDAFLRLDGGFTYDYSERPGNGSRSRFHEAGEVVGGQRRHDRVLRAVGLKQDAAGLLFPVGAAADLVNELHHALGRTAVAAGQPKVGVDDGSSVLERRPGAIGIVVLLLSPTSPRQCS